MKTFWSELLEPTLFNPPQINGNDFDSAWKWLMAKPVIALTIVRNHSIRLHRQGHNPSAQMALIGVWMIFKPSMPPKKKMTIKVPPKRKTA